MSFLKSKFKPLSSVGKLGRAASSATGTVHVEWVKAERNKNSVAMGDHKSTRVRHGLFKCQKYASHFARQESSSQRGSQRAYHQFF